MKGTFNHVQFNVASPSTSLPFYKDLLTYLEMQVIVDEPDFLGVSDGQTSFWFLPAEKDHIYDRDAAGINHIGIAVASKNDVDAFSSGFMKPRGIDPQWDTPRSRPDFGDYYQVMFEDPEGLAIEVFHAE